MKGIYILISALLAQLAWLCLASADSFRGIPVEVLRVQATDGVQLSMYHLKSPNPNAPVILLEPGIVETAEMMSGMAASFFERGYDVYIGQVRLAGRGANVSGEGVRNGLEEVLLHDFPAHLREVIRRSGGRKIHLLGHSMGGLEILATLSDPKLAPGFEPHIEAVTLVTAPSNLSSVPWTVKLQVRALLPMLYAARKLIGRASLGPHTTLFEFTQRLQGTKSSAAIKLARAIEDTFINVGTLVLNKTLISMNHTSPEAIRKLWLSGVSALPLDLLIDFGEAALRGEFRTRNGRPLVRPEFIRVPVQVVRAEHDLLVPWKEQARLYKSLASRTKRLVSLSDMKHVDPVMDNRHEWNFLPIVVDFHDSPVETAKRLPHVLFRPALIECEKYLRAPVPASALQF